MALQMVKKGKSTWKAVCFNRVSTIQAKSCLANFSIHILFPQIFARREASHLFEEAGEMMGIIETQKARGLADVVAVHEQALGLVEDVIVDVADGRTSCRLVDDVAEITRRIGQFRSAIGNGRKSLRQLPILAEILLKQVVKAFQEVAVATVFLGELTLVNAVAIL